MSCVPCTQKDSKFVPLSTCIVHISVTVYSLVKKQLTFVSPCAVCCLEHPQLGFLWTQGTVPKPHHHQQASRAGRQGASAPFLLLPPPGGNQHQDGSSGSVEGRRVHHLPLASPPSCCPASPSSKDRLRQRTLQPRSAPSGTERNLNFPWSLLDQMYDLRVFVHHYTHTT